MVGDEPRFDLLKEYGLDDFSAAALANKANDASDYIFVNNSPIANWDILGLTCQTLSVAGTFTKVNEAWPNRDPFEEPGFEVMQRGAPYRTHPFGRTPAELIEGPNLYYFVGNNPMFYGDPFGLSVCGDFGNGLNNTVSAIGESMGQGLYDLSHGQWSQGQYERIADKMYSLNTPDNPAATPYVEGALGVSAAAAASAAALGSLEAAGIIDTAPQGNNVIRVVCKPLQQGLRLDKPHHGKWYHWHWWKW